MHHYEGMKVAMSLKGRLAGQITICTVQNNFQNIKPGMVCM